MKNSKGFALIESLIAVLILALGIIGAMGMQTRGISSMTEASGRAEATIAAEQLMGMMWYDLTNIDSYAWSGSGSPPTFYADWYADLTTNHLPGAVVTVAVTRYGPTNQGAQVDITLSWQRPGSPDTRRVAVSTFMSPP